MQDVVELQAPLFPETIQKSKSEYEQEKIAVE